MEGGEKTRRSPEKLTGGNRRAGQTGVTGCGHGPSSSPLSCEPRVGPRCCPAAAAASPSQSAGAAPRRAAAAAAAAAARARLPAPPGSGWRRRPAEALPAALRGRAKPLGRSGKRPRGASSASLRLGSRAYLVTGTGEPPCQRLPAPPPFPSLPVPSLPRLLAGSADSPPGGPAAARRSSPHAHKGSGGAAGRAAGPG